MKTPEVTIIVPAYNAAGDLSACIESLCSQTLIPQIVIANDGSTDETAIIADSFAERFEFVRVLHFAHGGLIATRRASVPTVKTKFFAFVDADDAIEPTFVEAMLSAATASDADIVFCPYTCVYDGVARHVSFAGDGAAFSLSDMPLRKQPQLLLSIPTFYWGKLFRAAYFRSKIVFPSETCIPLEDIPAIVPLLIDAPRIAKVEKALYRYSISHKSMARVRKQELNRLASMNTLQERMEAIGALPQFLPQLRAINRCHLFDQLEKLRWYCDPKHQHRVIREFFRHLNSGALRGWRPHPFHPTFYAAYWHGIVARNSWQNKRRRKDMIPKE